jgi:hypothetical protein
VIRTVLTRQNRFIRKSPGKKIEEQVIADNVDTRRWLYLRSIGTSIRAALNATWRSAGSPE